jgi:hypothetical protein
MLPTADMMRWLKAQGAEKVLKFPSGNMMFFRRSVSMKSKNRVYWSCMSVEVVDGGYLRDGDTFLLCDPPPTAAEYFDG